MFSELMSLTKQCLDVFLREMDVMRRNFNEKGLLLLRLQYARDVRAA